MCVSLSLNLSLFLFNCACLCACLSSSARLSLSFCWIGQHCGNLSLMCKTHCPIRFRNLYIAFSQSKHLEQRSLSFMLIFTQPFRSVPQSAIIHSALRYWLLFLAAYSWKCHFKIWVCHDWDIDPSLVLSLYLIIMLKWTSCEIRASVSCKCSLH